MAVNHIKGSSHPQFRILFLGTLAVVLVKLFLAFNLDLYSDEIFYWQASTYPALAYSDLPFMTALLVGIGSSLDTGNPFTVRIIFIILGSSIPFLIYWLALPIIGKRQAIDSATLSLCVPLLGFIGLLAVPDVPLIFWGILSIGFFERALRTNQTKFWLLTGLMVALGFCTHYRFILYPVSAIFFLLCFKPARKQWSNPKLWLTIITSVLGLIPILWFNITNDLESALFYFVERHPWEFQTNGLLHVFKQALVVSPPLYLMFLITIYHMYLKAKANELAPALLLSFSLTNLLVYLVLAPWADLNSTNIHWPLSGYIPLLVFTPFALRETYQWASDKFSTTIARKLCRIIPAIGFSGTIIAFIAVGSQAFQLPIQALIGPGILSNKMAGWDEFASHTQELLEREFPEIKPIIVTDNYYTAAQSEFAGLSRQVFTLDRSKSVRDGRLTQYEIWQKHESALSSITGIPVLYINEDSTLTTPDKHRLLAVMCHYVDNMEIVDELSLYKGEKSFSFYRSDNLLGKNVDPLYRADPCPFPPNAWIDYPKDGDIITDNISVDGWAFNEDIGIERIELVINNEIIATANYGIERTDVVSAMSVNHDPNSPHLGFKILFNTTTIPNGKTALAIDLINRQGTRVRYGERIVLIEN